MTQCIYRRLPLAKAKRAASRLVEIGDNWQSAAELVSITSLDFDSTPNSTFGNQVTDEQLYEFRNQVLALQVHSLGSRTSAAAKSEFDAEFTSRALELLDMPRFEAGQDDVWRYLALRVVPDVMQWRWTLGSTDAEGEGEHFHDASSGRAKDRFYGMARERHGLGRLWWRRAVLGDLATTLTENELIRLQERSFTVASRPAIMLRLAELAQEQAVTDSINRAKDKFLDAMIKELSARFALVSIDLMSESAQRQFVDEVYPGVLKRYLDGPGE